MNETNIYIYVLLIVYIINCLLHFMCVFFVFNFCYCIFAAAEKQINTASQQGAVVRVTGSWKQ